MTLLAANLTLAEVKAFLKVEHALDDSLITLLTEAAIDEAGNYLNRDFEPGELPAAVKLDILRLIAWRFENMGDTTAGLPPIPFNGFNQYRLLPGL